MSLIAGAIHQPEGQLLKGLTEHGSIDLDNATVRDDPALRQAAEDFEAAFISQMLKFSGLGEALTKGGGEGVAAFTDFYIQNYAEKIVEKGGFGLADRFYNKLAAKAGIDPNLSAGAGGLDVRS